MITLVERSRAYLRSFTADQAGCPGGARGTGTHAHAHGRWVHVCAPPPSHQPSALPFELHSPRHTRTTSPRGGTKTAARILQWGGAGCAPARRRARACVRDVAGCVGETVPTRAHRVQSLCIDVPPLADTPPRGMARNNDTSASIHPFTTRDCSVCDCSPAPASTHTHTHTHTHPHPHLHTHTHSNGRTNTTQYVTHYVHHASRRVAVVVQPPHVLVQQRGARQRPRVRAERTRGARDLWQRRCEHGARC